jgi:hypothetical protein
MDCEKAKIIAQKWIDLWNNDTVDKYQTQYREDIVLVSSVALRLFPDINGRITDKKVLKEFWELVRIKFPNYKFIMTDLTCYENKILIFYSTTDVTTKAIAILTVDEDGMIYKCEVSYV